MKTVWAFKTRRFEVSLKLEQDQHYRYDGDDEDGSTQAKLDSGEYIAFTSKVCVDLDGVEIGSNWLSGSVYAANTVPEFWMAHRDPNPMHRNSSIMRAAKGDNVVVSHYFPGMVKEAIAEAREHIRDLDPPPYIRTAASPPVAMLRALLARTVAASAEMDDPTGDGRGTNARPPDGDDWNTLNSDVLITLSAAINLLEGK